MSVLQHDSQRTAQIRFLNLIDVDSVIPYLTVLNVIEAVNQVRNRGLTRAGRTDEGNLLSRLCIQLHVMENHLIIIISEIYAVKYDVAL